MEENYKKRNTMKKIKLGFAPTRRSIFSAPDAVKYRGLTAERLKELGVDFVDITDINEEGLLYDDHDVDKIVEKFKKEKVDGVIFPHCNFGTEYVCARLAKKIDVPVLLWGPLDERPEPDGVRLRDTQCGLFATGKVLRRFQIPFTYLTSCRLNDPVFERGIKDFMAVCNVVKEFRNIRILQISTRPFDFWTTMCNEAEVNRLKAQLSKANSEAADYKKQLRGKQSEDEAAAAEQKATMDKLTQENADLKRSMALSEKKAKLLAMGYDEKLADDTATAMVDGDMDKVMANQTKYLEAREKDILAKKMKGTPRPAAGSENTGGMDYQKKIEEAQASGDLTAVAYYTRLAAQDAADQTE